MAPADKKTLMGMSKHMPVKDLGSSKPYRGGHEATTEPPAVDKKKREVWRGKPKKLWWQESSMKASVKKRNVGLERPKKQNKRKEDGGDGRKRLLNVLLT